MTSNHLSIGELSAQCGVTAHTLRFYEAEGILMPAGRLANGHRRYHAADVHWLEFVLRLKRTGMPLADIRAYAVLRARGDGTLDERLAMLQRHRERLAMQIEALTTNARALDDKIEIYRSMIATACAPAKKADP